MKAFLSSWKKKNLLFFVVNPMFFKISKIVTTIVIAVCKLKQLKVKYTKKRETSPCFSDKILSYDENVVYTHSECRELDLIVLMYVPLHLTQCISHKIDSKNVFKLLYLEYKQTVWWTYKG